MKKNKFMVALVIGGAEFIYSIIVKIVNMRNYEIAVFDNNNKNKY